MNGPMGRYEERAFSEGTRGIIRCVALTAHDRGVIALIAGGDTGAALGEIENELARNAQECSSGKAFLHVLASRSVEVLPGVRALARQREAGRFPIDTPGP